MTSLLQTASPILGVPRPEGDPAGMRLYAKSLRASAELIGSVGEASSSAISSATFEGPAGDRTRARAKRMRSRASLRAAEIRQLADAISREAGQLEERQRHWDRLDARLRAKRGDAGGP